MYFFIGSEFSDRVPQNVNLLQAQRVISESRESLMTTNSPQTRVSPVAIPRTQSAIHRNAQ